MIRFLILPLLLALGASPALAQQPSPQQQAMQQAVAARIGELELANMTLMTQLRQAQEELAAAKKPPAKEK